ncbi:MAG: monovalent cation/H+ antiporter subunit D family protein [Magnetococcales bacterium]|nr:monovalent cation/H+ antiporter subunit D family protein [Magnetococcales bacterium]
MSPEESLLVSLLLIPLLGGIGIVLVGRAPNVREGVTLVTAVSLFYTVLEILPLTLNGNAPAVTLWQMMPGFEISLKADPLGMVFALVASGLWIINSIYSIGYMRGNNEKNQTRFYLCFALSLASVMGLALASNLLTLFVFYEALTLATFPLVTHHGTEKAKKSGRTYLGILLATSVAFQLLAIIITYVTTGTMDFAEGGILAGHVSGMMVGILLFLYMYGIGKAALMPIHRWLPAAMVAPTPVSALLHAVAVVKAGVFSVVRIVLHVFGIDLLASNAYSEWLLYVSGGTILIASTIALMQDNLKRRLAYSTISQLSYVVMATAILTPISVVGAIFHIAAHAFGKITLFFAAGSIYTAAHKTEISQLDGIGRKMPWTMGAFAVGSLCMVGLPPTAGFISKWHMLEGALQTEQFFVVLVLSGSSLLAASYLFPIVFRAFFKAPPPVKDPYHDHGEAPVPIVIALTATASLTILLFFFHDIPLEMAKMATGLDIPQVAGAITTPTP